MTPEHGGQLCIRTDNMELAGDIVQDLCRYLKIDNVESIADFPIEMDEFQDVIQRVNEYNQTRQKMSADIADISNVVKTLVNNNKNNQTKLDASYVLEQFSHILAFEFFFSFRR
jgi:Bardet-Biedl syndrome 2 protein